MPDFYLSDNKLYVKDGDIYRNVGISAKDKVVTTRKLESTTVVIGEVTLPKLKNALPVSMSEAIAKFAISEMHPLLCESAPERSNTGEIKTAAVEPPSAAVVPPVVPPVEVKKKPAQKRPGARK